MGNKDHALYQWQYPGFDALLCYIILLDFTIENWVKDSIYYFLPLHVN